MSSYLFSITAQSNTGSDWNWFLIFIIFVVVLAIALIIQAKFSQKDAAKLEHHEEDDHHEETGLAPASLAEPEVESEPEPEAASEPEEATPATETPAEPDDLKKLIDDYSLALHLPVVMNYDEKGRYWQANSKKYGVEGIVWSEEDQAYAREYMINTLWQKIADKSPRCAELVELVRQQARDLGRVK